MRHISGTSGAGSDFDFLLTWWNRSSAASIGGIGYICALYASKPAQVREAIRRALKLRREEPTDAK